MSYENFSDKELREQFWYQQGKKEGLIMGRSLQDPLGKRITDSRIDEMNGSIDRVEGELKSRQQSK